MSRLSGKVCVVNGAASTIGQAVAERFAGEGGVVVGVDKVAHDVGDLALQADLADEAQVVSGYAAGTYQVTFEAAQRGSNTAQQNIQVLVDGSVVGTFTQRSSTTSGAPLMVCRLPKCRTQVARMLSSVSQTSELSSIGVSNAFR